MKTTFPWLLAVAALSPLPAQGPATARPDVGRRLEELEKEQEKLISDWQAARAAAVKAAQEAQADGKPGPASPVRPDCSPLRAKYLAAAKEYTGEDRVRLLVPALQFGGNKQEMLEVFDQLLQDHIKSKNLGDVGPMLDYIADVGGADYAAKAFARL